MNEIVESSSPLKCINQGKSEVKARGLMSSAISSLAHLSRRVLGIPSAAPEIENPIRPSTNSTVNGSLSGGFLEPTDQSMFSEDDTEKHLDPLDVRRRCCY